MLAMIVTSLLRGRLNRILWRAIHLLAYLSWPVAFAHSIGSSTDMQHGWLLDLAIGCAAARGGRDHLAAGQRGPPAAPGGPGRRRLASARPLRVGGDQADADHTDAQGPGDGSPDDDGPDERNSGQNT